MPRAKPIPFAARLRQLRHARSWTQGELAERAGLQLNTISRYELGNCKPDFDAAGRLADALGVTVDVLRGGKV